MKTEVTREMLDTMAVMYGIERPYEVCVHTTMGSYMEFIKVEKCVAEDTARMVADSYAETYREGKDKSEYFKSICVRKDRHIIYEVML